MRRLLIQRHIYPLLPKGFEKSLAHLSSSRTGRHGLMPTCCVAFESEKEIVQLLCVFPLIVRSDALKLHQKLYRVLERLVVLWADGIALHPRSPPGLDRVSNACSTFP
ncbi:hypothetical protein BV898_04016 [Hypsibius exemplaris]|uniref:Uncharacterized protein n=1 Tax=Hypsibius exemplaris TaxID=2072580 RepID=A0A1W0X3U3_HYPEX|nr:hypothetical protein BV898_04016 [Hypsibius exemplaris]